MTRAPFFTGLCVPKRPGMWEAICRSFTFACLAGTSNVTIQVSNDGAEWSQEIYEARTWKESVGTLLSI